MIKGKKVVGCLKKAISKNQPAKKKEVIYKMKKKKKRKEGWKIKSSKWWGFGDDGEWETVKKEKGIEKNGIFRVWWHAKGGSALLLLL